VRHLRAIVILLGLSGVVAVAAAQPPASASLAPHPPSEYGGVTPGGPNPPPRVARLRGTHRVGRGRSARPAEIIAWPGFQMEPSGGSRFFVQTTGPVTTEVHPSSGRIEIVFHDSTIHLQNSRRWLETEFFETPVVRARLERRRTDMVLVMQLRAAVSPVISTGADANGFTFTYIDFAPGHFLPDAPITVPVPRHDDGAGTASVRPSTPDSQADYPAHEEDTERPPPVQMH
jgi:hypothetical protein